MSSQFKNRLVGVTILVALVVIFLPSIIDGKKVTYQQEFVATPINPDLQQHTKSIPVNIPLSDSTDEDNTIPTDGDEETAPINDWQVEEVASTVQLDNNSTIDDVIEPEPTPAKAPAPIISPAPIKVIAPTPAVAKPVIVAAPVIKSGESAWTIQLGAFKNKANIDALLAKLIKGGYQAHSVPKIVVDGQLTRVYVGPDVSKTKLEKLLPALKDLTNLSGKVVSFNPTTP